jgi:hypothetical protein
MEEAPPEHVEPQRAKENIAPSPETIGEAHALNYVWDAAMARLRIPFIVNKSIAQELMSLVRIYPRDWRRT